MCKYCLFRQQYFRSFGRLWLEKGINTAEIRCKVLGRISPGDSEFELTKVFGTSVASPQGSTISYTLLSEAGNGWKMDQGGQSI